MDLLFRDVMNDARLCSCGKHAMKRHHYNNVVSIRGSYSLDRGFLLPKQPTQSMSALQKNFPLHMCCNAGSHRLL